MDVVVLESDRLLLRPFYLSDAQEVQKLAGEKRVSDTLIHVPYPYEDGMAEAWIGTHSKLREEDTELNFAITKKITGNHVRMHTICTSNEVDPPLIGSVSLRVQKQHKNAELGYWVGFPYWGQGFGTEAAGCLLEFGFTTLNLQRVHAHYLSRNRASGRILEKIGMRHEGTMREHRRTEHGFEDIEFMGITRSDYEKLSNT